MDHLLPVETSPLAVPWMIPGKCNRRIFLMRQPKVGILWSNTYINLQFHFWNALVENWYFNASINLQLRNDFIVSIVQILCFQEHMDHFSVMCLKQTLAIILGKQMCKISRKIKSVILKIKIKKLFWCSVDSFSPSFAEGRLSLKHTVFTPILCSRALVL